MTVQPNIPTSTLQQDRRQSVSVSLFRIFAVGAIGGALICALLYQQSGVWQILAVAISLLVAIILGAISLVLVRVKKTSLAKSFALSSVLIGYISPLLLWEHAAGYMIIGGGLVILLISGIMLTKWGHRVAIFLTFFCLAVISSRLPLFPRFNIQNSPALNILLPTFIFLIGLGVLWQVLRLLQFSTIRTRLLVSFLVIAVLPLVIVAIVSGSIGSQATINSSKELLTAVITLKESELNTWIDNLQASLHIENVRDEQYDPLLALLKSERDSVEFKISYRNLANRLGNSISMRGEFIELLILDQQGAVVLSTNRDHEGYDLGKEAYYTGGINGKFFLPPDFINLLAEQGVVVSEPVQDSEKAVIGVLVGLADLEKMTEIMEERGGFGQTGETYLVNHDFIMLTPSIYKGYSQGGTKVLTDGTLEAVLGQKSGSGLYENYEGIEVIGVYRWNPDFKVAIIAEQSSEEVSAPTYATIAITSVVSLILIIGTTIFAITTTNSIARPLAGLTSTAQRIAEGELYLDAPVSGRNDEVTTLALSFNTMTQQLRKLIINLEQRVEERTRDLQSRTEQLQAAANLNSIITSILDEDKLIDQVVELIRERFHLYYVGLFMLDESREQADLRAASGESGQSLLERRHRLKLSQGMVGWCIQHGQARVAPKAEEDIVRIVNPDLPETRSEAAIPLRSRGQVLGAFSIQSRQPNAFDEAALSTFQSMADQVATAIDNARLFTETQKALEATRRAYGELSRQAWKDRLNARSLQVSRSSLGLSVREIDTTRMDEDSSIDPDTSSRGSNGAIDIPIKVRDSVIGVLHARKSAAESPWSEHEREMLTTLIEQLGVALESARLFEETLLRAERERVISDITNRVRESLDIDTVLMNAAEELRKSLDLEEVEVRLSEA